MRQILRLAGVLIGSALLGVPAMNTAGLSQELSIENPTGGGLGELSRQKTTSGELPAASDFQELNQDEEPPLPYVAPDPEKPVVDKVAVEPEPKSKKTDRVKKPRKKIVQPNLAPTPSTAEGTIRVIPIEEIPIVGVEVASEVDDAATAPASRSSDQVDRN